MNKSEVTLQLPPDLMRAVHDLATEREGTVASVMASLLEAHLGSQKASKTRPVPTPDRLIFALQQLLFRDMAEARDWADLDLRLRNHGYFLQVTWGGLALHTLTSGKRICLTHDLGFSYGTFIRRFGPGKPKNPHEE